MSDLYKLLVKVLANRLKRVVGKVLIANETIDSLMKHSTVRIHTTHSQKNSSSNGGKSQQSRNCIDKKNYKDRVVDI